jgi:glycosyltransferase involved in cell wall biosynthesis
VATSLLQNHVILVFNRMKLLSIIMPSYNQGLFIESSISSVLDSQEHRLELIVIDGGSTDGTLDVLKRYEGRPGFRFISEPDDGPASAVNKGFGLAKGLYCGIQSTDDIYSVGTIPYIISMIDNGCKWDLIFGNYGKLDVNDNVLNIYNQKPYTLERLFKRQLFICQCSAFFLTEKARKLGFWDTRLGYTPDTSLWFSLAITGSTHQVQRCLGFTREHPNQRNTQVANISRDYWKMISINPQIRSSGLQIKLWALIGALELALDYGAHLTKPQRVLRLMMACMLSPDLINDPIPGHALIPGYFFATKVKSMLSDLLP